jgi:hypothetical protein
MCMVDSLVMVIVVLVVDVHDWLSDIRYEIYVIRSDILRRVLVQVVDVFGIFRYILLGHVDYKLLVHIGTSSWYRLLAQIGTGLQ